MIIKSLTYTDGNYIKYHGDQNLLVNRLFELENQIERGELISTKKNDEQEIAFFVQHNEKVRKLAAADIFARIMEKVRYLQENEYDGLCADDWKEILKCLAAEYGVKLYESSGRTAGTSHQAEKKRLADQEAYGKRVAHDIFERLIEQTKAVNASDYDGLGVENLKLMAKEYGVNLEKQADKQGEEKR